MNSTSTALDDPVVARLVGGVCCASQEILKVRPGVFAMAVAIDDADHIGVFHISAADSTEWLDLQRNVDAALTAALASGQFQAVAICLNIAHPGIYEPGAIPVLAIRVVRTAGQPIDVRVHYKLGPDRTVRFEPPTVASRQEDAPN